ncbi:putative odorant receptor 92a [Teleopsis dalmanni]|uniref:putative odorant receptor 92a n=1 Tax=Teleopsis dalmanni TaxID=139649 RepID=UPI0018CD1555|nr:putative odorant receptor 92a [Teleopsis dalmanni]
MERLCKKMEERFSKTSEDNSAFDINNHLKRNERFNKSIVVCDSLVCLMFCIFPIIQSFLEYLSSSTEDRKFVYLLPYMMWYPFNTQRLLNYIVAFSSQCLVTYMITSFYLGHDMFLTTFVYIVNMYLSYIEFKIHEFKPTNTDEDNHYLSQLLAFHSDIYGYVKQIDEIFSIAMLWNYFAACLTLCLVGYQVAAGTDYLHLLKFFGFLVSMLWHVYIISVVSTELITQSSGIGDAFYHQEWYDASNKYKRMLLLPIARAQRPAHITAFKFFDISMQSFTNLLSTTYQVFTLLRTSLETST